MAHVQGCLVIDATASALNNAGSGILGERDKNTIAVKFIRAQDGGYYPYVSAQAGRYWLRTTLEQDSEIEWIASPVWGDSDGAVTNANPIDYWDDDLLGYMRATTLEQDDKIMQQAIDRNLAVTKMHREKKTKKGGKEQVTIASVTRSSPFRLGTLVSIGSVNLTRDFGVMARQDAYPVLHEHQFYVAKLHGLFSFNLREAGKFYSHRRSGFQNLDPVRVEIAKAQNLAFSEAERVFRLPLAERARRVRSLLLGLGRLTGGAKQSTHYTDVSPAVIIAAVMRTGNHPFNYLFNFNKESGKIEFSLDVFQRAVEDVYNHNLLLSPVYVGWKPGFLPEERAKVEALTWDMLRLTTPLAATAELAEFITANLGVMDQ